MSRIITTTLVTYGASGLAGVTYGDGLVGEVMNKAVVIDRPTLTKAMSVI
jgi:hypothetical protein